MMFTQTCLSCFRTNKTPCQACQSTGAQDSEISLSVSIPPGIQNFNILRLPNMGNYIGNQMFFNEYTDVFVQVQVEQQENMAILNNDVVSTYNISLLDALQRHFFKSKYH